MKFTAFLIISMFFVMVSSQAYEDRRCRCICPIQLFNGSLSNERKIFTSDVPPNKCNCYGFIITKVDKDITLAEEFCSRCECNYETRNTTLILVVVILVLWVMAMLGLYLVFLVCLDPLLAKKPTVKMYTKPVSDEHQYLLEIDDYEDE